MDDKQFEEASKLFKGFVFEEEVAELKTFPIFHDIYIKKLLSTKENLCFSSGFSVMLAHLSRPLNFYKINIHLTQESNKPYVPMNIYIMNILSSGGGKGLSNNVMEDLLSFEKSKNDFINEVFMSENPSKEDKIILEKLKSLSKCEILNDATTAGLRNLHKGFKDSINNLNILNDFGSAFYNLEEFADYLETSGSFQKDFLSSLKEIYDLGNLGGKVLADNVKEPIKKFYVSFVASTTDKTLQENGKVSSLFNQYLISGNARRSLMAVPGIIEFEKINNKAKKNDGLNLRELFEATRYNSEDSCDLLRQKISQKVTRFKEMLQNDKNSIELTSEAYFYYSVYKKYCSRRAENISGSILKVEMENRHWKALKISGLLMLYVEDYCHEINEKYYLEAIKIVEYYSFHLKRFLRNRVMGVADKIAEILIDSIKNGITRKDLMGNNEVNSYRPSNMTSSKFIESQMSEVEELLEHYGYRLEIIKGGYRSKITVYAALPNEGNYQVDTKEPYRIWNNVPKGYKHP